MLIGCLNFGYLHVLDQPLYRSVLSLDFKIYAALDVSCFFPRKCMKHSVLEYCYVCTNLLCKNE